MNKIFLTLLLAVTTIYPQSNDLKENYRILILPSKDAKSEVLRDELTSALSASSKIQMIDRDKISATLKEMTLAQQGVLDEASAPKIGKLVSANKFISISTNANKITIKFSDVETAKLEWSRTDKNVNTLSKELIEFIEHKLFLHNMALMKSPDSDYKVTLKSSKQKYKNNEEIQFTVSMNKDGHLYLLLLQSNGEIITLFPNDDHPNSFVKAKEMILIPDKNSGFTFAAGEPFGVDVVKAIVSKDELKLFKTKKIEGAPFSQSEVSGEDTLRGIKKITTGTNPKNWNSSEISVEIVE